MRLQGQKHDQKGTSMKRKPPFNIIIARPVGMPIIDPMPWGSLCRIHGMVVSVLTRVEDGVEDIAETKNIITNDGDLFYSYMAQMVAGDTIIPTDLFTNGATPSVFDGVVEVYTNVAVEPENVGKTANRQTLTDNSGVAAAVSTGPTVTKKAMETGYPKRNDLTAANTGKLPDAITYKVSYSTAQLNVASMDDVIITNPELLAADKLLMWADGLGRSKTNSDTLDIYINHTMNGI
jgi:hypothetical protein